MLQEFTNDKNATEIGEKMSSVYDQGVITDRFEVIRVRCRVRMYLVFI